MFKNIRNAVILSIMTTAPLTAMMEPNVSPCSPPPPFEYSAENLERRAKALFGDETQWRYYIQDTLDLYLKIAKSGDLEVIKQAHDELDKVKERREFDDVYLF